MPRSFWECFLLLGMLPPRGACCELRNASRSVDVATAALVALSSQLGERDVNASRSLAVPGRTDVLQHKLRQCFSHNSSLRVGVLGNSMTFGNMNCMGAHPLRCSDKAREERLPLTWPSRLESLLREALPCAVIVDGSHSSS